MVKFLDDVMDVFLGFLGMTTFAELEARRNQWGAQ